LHSGGFIPSQQNIVNENPDVTVSEPIAWRILLLPLSDETVLQLDRGMPLFLWNALQDVKKGEYEGHSLQTMNFHMEMAQRHAIERGQMPSSWRLSARNQSTAQQRTIWDKYQQFPTTVEEFDRSVSFLGLFESTNAPVAQRKKDIAVAVQGEITNVPNIWGAVETNASVGFKVKRVQNKSRSLVDAYGRPIGSATVGDILQIVPHVEMEGRKPIMAADGEKLTEQDIDFIQPTIVQQFKHQFEEGRLKWDKGAGEEYSALEVPLYTQGAYMEVGRVVRRTVPQNPSDDDIWNALRTFKGWNDLSKADLTIDIELTGNPHLWWR
jgi:hypothetical protein